jgi:hypothetical protein
MSKFQGQASKRDHERPRPSKFDAHAASLAVANRPDGQIRFIHQVYGIAALPVGRRAPRFSSQIAICNTSRCTAWLLVNRSESTVGVNLSLAIGPCGFWRVMSQPIQTLTTRVADCRLFAPEVALDPIRFGQRIVVPGLNVAHELVMPVPLLVAKDNCKFERPFQTQLGGRWAKKTADGIEFGAATESRARVWMPKAPSRPQKSARKMIPNRNF